MSRESCECVTLPGLKTADAESVRKRLADQVDDLGETMNPIEEELKILMSEKEQADKLIGSYLELQIKVHTFIFTVAAAAAGWIFAQNKGEVSSEGVQAPAVLALSFLGSFAVLQGISVYGIVLGYIRYKHLEIGKRMGALLGLKRIPLTALPVIASSSSNRIVIASSTFGGVFLLGGSGGLLVYAILRWGRLFLGGVLACAVLWLVTVILGLRLVGAMADLKQEAESSKFLLADHLNPTTEKKNSFGTSDAS